MIPAASYEPNQTSCRVSRRNLHAFAELALGVGAWFLATTAWAQAVCLPLPRLLTTMPMGGQAGTEFEVTITGDNLEESTELHFSHPGITARPQAGANGQPEPNRFVVQIAADTPAGIHEARMMTRLGISSSRVFTVGTVQEVVRTKPNVALAEALELKLNSICNAFTTAKSVDYYSFEAQKGQRVVVDCAARGIDSRMHPVLIVADAAGRDLVVERRGGALDFTPPADGRYYIKVHELTFQGGPTYFYRLALQEAPGTASLPRLPATQQVSSFSWPPAGLPESAATAEVEPNNKALNAQRIALPCDLAGSFYPAADVDTFEFLAKKGEVWWIEVASERLGLPTDPSLLVQIVRGEGDQEQVEDVAELSDIPSPVKPSSNNYSYDGPPYNGGSADILGKLEIKEDGRYRLQLRDLFGATRNDPRNVYRLVIRKPAPDFALVAWALHMELRNGDRNALSKPLALRGGTTTALEVVAVRRDGFDGPIDLVMENLPPGVSAAGLRIPAGKSRGLMLVTAEPDAPRGLASATFVGRAEIGGATIARSCRLASMAWPVVDAWSEIPSPRLLADVPVSVSGTELAPLTLAAQEEGVLEGAVGGKVTVPLVHSRRSEFSGATMQMRTFGEGFEQNPAFDISLNAERSEVVIDLAKLKTAPGDYLIAFYGTAVPKYRYNPGAVILAEEAQRRAEQVAAELAAEAKRLAEAAQSGPEAARAEAAQAAQATAEKQKAAAAEAQAAANRLKTATELARPKDIAEIIVSKPVAIRIKPAETK